MQSTITDISNPTMNHAQRAGPAQQAHEVAWDP